MYNLTQKLLVALAFLIIPLWAQKVQAQPKITGYDECVAAGNLILKTFPARCITADKQVFVDGVDVELNPSPIVECVDQCGNGSCEEMVCLGSGCPCTETVESCPADCVKTP